MKNIEGNPDDLLNQFPFLIDTDSVKSVGVAWLFKENGAWSLFPRLTGNDSLFYNSVFFVRIGFPLCFFLSLRWSSSTTQKSLFQTGIGWKLNGRFAITFRVQSDTTSAAGSAGRPNVGQATGFDYGTH